MKINVLGTEYEIVEKSACDDEVLLNSDGYCDFSINTIVISSLQETHDSMQDLEACKKRTMRHEIVHAFLHESGLGVNSWGQDEEIVDWIALQFPKIMKAFIRAGALDV